MMWTKRQLQNAMRKAGYVRLPGPGSTYQHKQTGKKVYLDEWKDGRHEWRQWAAARMTPPPF
jgi:hypothetical protein